jgi:hypothetical protein
MTREKVTVFQMGMLENFNRCTRAVNFAKQVFKETGESEMSILDNKNRPILNMDKEYVKMVEGGMRGLYNEAVHPLVGRERITDDFAKKLADKIVFDASKVHYELRKD